MTPAEEHRAACERQFPLVGRIVFHQQDIGRETIVDEMHRAEASDDLDDLLDFEVEEGLEDLAGHGIREPAPGTFVSDASPALSVSDDEETDWEIDLAPADVTGEGIGLVASVAPDPSAERDFLKVTRGLRSTKRAVVYTGTRLSIDSDACLAWVVDVLAKGWFSADDLGALVALCEGNGEPGDLRTNVRLNVESAGLDFIDHADEPAAELWDARTDISPDDLAESVEAVLTRAVRLPGTERFAMEKSYDLQLVKPMIQAKQDLQLSTLASDAAVDILLAAVEGIRDGSTDPATVSLTSIYPARRGHADTQRFLAAAEELKLWRARGRRMEGKGRREALAALKALQLSLPFHKTTVKLLKRTQASAGEAERLERLVVNYEQAAQRLVVAHIPYARRFAARRVEDGEDPEDVFQVTFAGLPRAVRRFDPERGIRFASYSNFWMNQALSRWRATEGSLIRVAVHHHPDLGKLDRAIDKMYVTSVETVPDSALAAELRWTAEKVRQLRGIPRVAVYPENMEGWDELFSEPECVDALERAEIIRAVAGVLRTLTPREEAVIKRRLGIGSDAEMTLQEVGQVFGVTRERIRQIETKAIRKLRQPGRCSKLRHFFGN